MSNNTPLLNNKPLNWGLTEDSIIESWTTLHEPVVFDDEGGNSSSKDANKKIQAGDSGIPGWAYPRIIVGAVPLVVGGVLAMIMISCRRRSDTSAPAQSIAAPSIAAPSIAAPSITAPSIAAPSIAAPSIAAPSIAAPSITDTPGEPGIICFIGDPHGDLEHLKLEVTACMDKKIDGEQLEVTFLGDYLDKGEQGLECLEYVLDLLEKNKKDIRMNMNNGIHVTALLGNHELWNMSGKFSYVSQTEKNLGKKYTDNFEMSDEHSLGTRALNNMKFIDVVELDGNEDSRSLIMHAGVNAKTMKELMEMSRALDTYHPGKRLNRDDTNKINEELRSLALNQIPNGKAGLSDQTQFNRVCIRKQDGILGTRFFAEEAREGWDKSDDEKKKSRTQFCQEIDAILNMTETKRIVVGHSVTYTKDESSLCEGKVVMGDFGSSKGMRKEAKPHLTTLVYNDTASKGDLVFEQREKGGNWNRIEV